MQVGKRAADELRTALQPRLVTLGLYLPHYYPSDGTLGRDFLIGKVKADVEDFSRELSLKPLLTVEAIEDGIVVLLGGEETLIATASGRIFTLRSLRPEGGTSHIAHEEFEYERDADGAFTLRRLHGMRTGLNLILSADSFSTGVIRCACGFSFE